MRLPYSFLIFVLAASVFAGEQVSIKLKNGKVFEGTVVSEDAKFVVLNSKGTDVRVLKAIIAEVDGAAYAKGDKILAGTSKESSGRKPPEAKKAPSKPKPRTAKGVTRKLESLRTGWPIAVKLKNGKIKRGKVLLIKNEYLTLDAGHSTVRILKRDVADLKRLSSKESKKQSGKDKTPERSTAKAQPKADTDAGDTHSIVLKNGTTFTGKVVSSSANFISFDINGRHVNILKAIIAQMDGRPYSKGAGEKAKKPAKGAQAPAPAAKPQKRKSEADEPRQAPVAEAKSTEKEVASTKAQRAPAKKPAKQKTTAAKTAPASTADKPEADSTKARTAAAKPAAEPKDASKTSAATESEPAEEKAVAAKESQQKEKPKATQEETGPEAQVAMAPVKEEKHVSVTEGLEEPRSGMAQELTRDVRAHIERLRYKEIEERIKAAAGLKKLGPEAAPAAPHLVELLGDTTVFQPGKRERKKYKELGIIGTTPADQALGALLAIGEPSVTPLMKTLSDIEESGAVSSAQDPRSVSPVIGALKQKDALLRQNVVHALGAIRDPRAIPLLLKVLDEDTNPSVLEKTENALKKLTDIPTLIEGLKSEHPVVKNNASYILWLMTAKDFKQDYDKWKQWWEEQQGGAEE